MRKCAHCSYFHISTWTTEREIFGSTQAWATTYYFYNKSGDIFGTTYFFYKKPVYKNMSLNFFKNLRTVCSYFHISTWTTEREIFGSRQAWATTYYFYNEPKIFFKFRNNFSYFHISTWTTEREIFGSRQAWATTTSL